MISIQATEGPTERVSSVGADERLGDRAYRAIKDGILRLTYPPGSALVDADLAVDLGVSRTPVREALVRLAGEGLVRITPRRGAVVTVLQRDDVRQIYELIDGLECLAVELIADRVRAGDLTVADLAVLDQQVQGMERALDVDDRATWIECDEEFHRLMRQLCGNAYLAETLQRFRELSQRVSRLTLYLRPKPVRSTDEHRRLLAAMQQGDAELARSIHHEHYRAVLPVMLELLDRRGLI